MYDIYYIIFIYLNISTNIFASNFLMKICEKKFIEIFKYINNIFILNVIYSKFFRYIKCILY